MLSFLKPKDSVDNIMEVFYTTITDLKELVKKKEGEVENIDIELAQLSVQKSNAEGEIERAENISSKLDSLLND